eukprot:13969235-Ditylum_brightwellii.AAC.1
MVLNNFSNMLVDDNILIHYTEMFDATDVILMLRIQHDAKIWGCLLWVPGGLLEFLKNTYCIIVCLFNANGEPHIATEEELQSNIVRLTDA